MNNSTRNKILQAETSLVLTLLLVLPISIPVMAVEDQHGQKAMNESGAPDQAVHEEAGHSENNSVHLTDAQLQHLKLSVGNASSGNAEAIIEAPASVMFDADSVARVGPLIESKVIRVNSDLGTEVISGDTLAVLDSVQLGHVKARYLIAVARYQSALAEYQRDKKLAEKQITSEAELLKSRADYLETKAERDAIREELRLYGLDQRQIDAISAGGKQPLSRYSLLSPAEGVIQRRDLVPGQTLTATDTPIHIVNTKKVWVMIDAYEKKLPLLAPGLPVTLTLRALPGEIFTGLTDWVSRELDKQSRTIRVRAVMPNPGGRLRAGMFGTATIQARATEEFAMVPVDAVQTIGNEKSVFVPGDEDGAFHAVPVELGDESGGLIEIHQGLEPGDAVVVQGAFDLFSILTAASRSVEHSH